MSDNKVSDKMAYANSADPDQTAAKGGSTLFAIPLSILTLIMRSISYRLMGVSDCYSCHIIYNTHPWNATLFTCPEV